MAATLGVDGGPPRRPAGVVVWAGIGSALLLAVVSAVLIAATWSPRVAPLADSHLLDASLVPAVLLWSLVGGLILVRRPANRTGLVLLGAGLLLECWIFSYRYASAGLGMGWNLPLADLAAWISTWTIVAGLALAFVVLPLLYPDGRPASSRQVPLAWFGVAVSVFVTVTWATEPGPMDSFEGVQNPFGIGGVGRLGLGEVGWALLVLAIVASAVSLTLRFRRARGIVRLQIRWVAFGAAFVAAELVAISVAGGTGWSPWLAVVVAAFLLVAVAALPTAAFIAIVAHELYDIDVVISKTVGFGLLAAAIGGVYTTALIGVGALVGSGDDPSVVVAVVATALAALVFAPVRTGTERLARRLVYGEKATPYDVLAGLSRQVGNAVENDPAPAQIAHIVAEGTGAVAADVWLVVGGQVRLVSSFPDSGDHYALRLSGGTLPALPGSAEAVPDKTVSVHYQGRLLGAIAVTMPPGRELTHTEGRLLDDLASQAGLVLSNVRLLEELRESRRRIINAQDDERRRIERDLHDGVQQQLLTLALDLRMASGDAVASTGEMRTVLDQAAVRTLEAMEDLRRVAHGIHPAIVSEGGLTVALESLADRSVLPVELRVSDVPRLPETVEVTIYHVVAEALTNAVKHSDADAVTVDVVVGGGVIRVRVEDDGSGGPRRQLSGASMVEQGSGLRGLADRVIALNGSFVVESEPGVGTAIEVEIPCGSP